MATRPTATTLALELGGKVAGVVRSLQLPGYRVEQVVVPTGPGGAARLGANISISALEAQFSPVQADALTEWALSLPRGKAAQGDGAALLLDANNIVARRVEWTEGLVTELRLPVLDAASKQAFSIEVKWQPGSVNYAKASGQVVKIPALKNKKAAQTSNFRVLGLPFNGAAFIKRALLPTLTAKLAEQAQGYAHIDSGELQLEFAATARDAVLAWVQKVVADGHIADGDYLGISIELLDPALKKVLLTVLLTGCALLGYEESRLEAAQESLPSVTLRFAVGMLDLQFSDI